MLYCTYNLLNMFRGLIRLSSGARDYTCVIAVYVFNALVVDGQLLGTEQQAMRTHSLLLCS